MNFIQSPFSDFFLWPVACQVIRFSIGGMLRHCVVGLPQFNSLKVAGDGVAFYVVLQQWRPQLSAA